MEIMLMMILHMMVLYNMLPLHFQMLLDGFLVHPLMFIYSILCCLMRLRRNHSAGAQNQWQNKHKTSSQKKHKKPLKDVNLFKFYLKQIKKQFKELNKLKKT
jgi:hypothetical protein